MSTARKRAVNSRSMSAQSRNKCYAAMNIMWLQMRPDLAGESSGTLREERLAWITSFLRLRQPLVSTTKLTDKQIGLVLDEMRNMTGAKPYPVAAPSSGNVVNLQQFKRQHYASDEQKYTLGKIIKHLGWSDAAVKDFLVQRGFGESVEKIAFKKANSLTMILLNIAADKALRRGLPKGTKITRGMTMKHIPFLKRQLQIGD